MSQSTSRLISEHVRRRPGMYIGGTGQRALNGCVFELIANSIEEHLTGRANSITVTIHEDGSLSVKDDGGGISVAPHAQCDAPFIEVAMTEHFPVAYVRKPYPVLGSGGVGTKCVNAVSEWMQINTVRDGDEFQIKFARGRTLEPLRKLSQSVLEKGTLIRFKPDPEIFKSVTFDRNFLAVRLDHLAVLHPKLVFALVDERPNLTQQSLVSLFHYPKGIADFLKLTWPAEFFQLLGPIIVDGESQGMKISLGFQFTESDNTSLLSFVNSCPTYRGGTPVQGLLEGLADTLNKLTSLKSSFAPEDVRPGLSAFIGVWLGDPRYGGAVKESLINPEVASAVRELVSSHFELWVTESGRVERLSKWLEEERGRKMHETAQ